MAPGVVVCRTAKLWEGGRRQSRWWDGREARSGINAPAVSEESLESFAIQRARSGKAEEKTMVPQQKRPQPGVEGRPLMESGVVGEKCSNWTEASGAPEHSKPGKSHSDESHKGAKSYYRESRERQE